MIDFLNVLSTLLYYFWKIDYPANIAAVAIMGWFCGMILSKSFVPSIHPLQIFSIVFFLPSGVMLIESFMWTVEGYGNPAAFYFLIWLPMWATLAIMTALGVRSTRLKYVKDRRHVQRY